MTQSVRDELTTITNYKFKFASAGKGFLAQEDPGTDPLEFDPLKNDFGLAKSSWSHFKQDFAALQRAAPENTRYKVLFLARHGQGIHNYAELKYGPEWDAYWAMQNGDGQLTWGPDPELTQLGIEQAKANNVAWKEQIEKDVPLPNTFYVSPFTRALDTMHYTWDNIMLTANKVDPPLVVEDIREAIGEHTCDKRRTRSFIEQRFARVVPEKSMTEQDDLWTPKRETPEEHNVRTLRFLHNLFNHDWEGVDNVDNYVSITAHSGTIKSFLRVVGHRDFDLLPGGMIPVIIRAEREE